MKKGLSILCLMLLSIAIVSASSTVSATVPIQQVQGPTQGTLSGTSISVTLAQTPQSGDVLIAVMGLKITGSNQPQVGPQITQTGVTWPASHTFTSTSSTSGSSIQIWWGIVNSATTSKTITIDLSHFMHGSGTITSATVNICEYSGLDTAYIQTQYVDQTIDNKGNGKNIDTSNFGSFNDPAPTTNYANELWVGGAILNSYSQSTPTNGFTMVNDGAVYGGVSVSYLEKIVSTTDQLESGTTGAGSGAWMATLASFPAAQSPFPAPEYSYGALIALAACFVGFTLFYGSKKWQKQGRYIQQAST